MNPGKVLHKATSIDMFEFLMKQSWKNTKLKP